jgi:hypothetical protein
MKKWCGWRGSNPRPLASEANTLSTELQPHVISLEPELSHADVLAGQIVHGDWL